MKLRRYTCRVVRGLLPLHVGGDLEAEQAEPVDEHLHTCLTCFREYRELLALRGRLGVLADPPLPAGILDGFTDEVMARIAVGEPGPAAELPGAPNRLRQLTRYAAAAALLLALSLGLATLSDAPAGIAPTRSRVPSVAFGDGSDGFQPASSAAVPGWTALTPRDAGSADDSSMQHSGSMATTVGDSNGFGLPYRDGRVDGASSRLAPWHPGLVPEAGRQLRLRNP